MMKFMPMTLYSLSTMLLWSSMTLMMMNKMMIMKWEICSIMSLMITMDIMMEWSSMMYSSIIMLISGSVMKFSKEYMKKDKNKVRFSYTVIMFILSMNLLIFIPNTMCMLIGWDGLGVTSFILVIYYNNSRSLSAGMLTMLTNRLGDMFLLMAIATTMNNGDWSFSIMMQNNYNMMMLP